MRQEPGAHGRRWFEGRGLELIVWLAAGGAPVGFQLCYQTEKGGEQALTWRPASGFSHARVDGGESRPDKNLTPILVNDGPVPWALVKERFTAQSVRLEPALRDYVLGALRTRTG